LEPSKQAMEAIKVRPSFETRVVIYLGYIHNYSNL
jgi:hypothetical protein